MQMKAIRALAPEVINPSAAEAAILLRMNGATKAAPWHLTFNLEFFNSL